MEDQHVNHVSADKEQEGPESVLGHSGFSGGGAAGAAPPPLQLTADHESAWSNGHAAVGGQEAPMQLWSEGLDRINNSSDQDLANAQTENAPEGWESEIGSVTTVDLDRINHQGLVNAVGDNGERRVQNHPGDVIVIQQLLVMHNNLNAGDVNTLAELKAEDDRHIPAGTLAALRAFQTELQEAGVIREVDGVVDPGGTTWNNLRADPETRDEPETRGDRETLTDTAENWAIEAEFEEELAGLEGDQRTYMLEMLSIVVGTNRDTRAAGGAEGDELALQANQAALDRLAQHIALNTDPGGANGDRSLVNSDTIMGFLHEIGYWTDFPRRAAAAAETEFNFWTDEADGGQRTEGEDRELLERLRTYTYSGDASVANATQAYNDEWPWSAVFISHVMHTAGAGDTFFYDPSHSQYAGPAYQNTHMPEDEREDSNEISNMFSADQDIADMGGPDEPVRVGDLIHFTRGNNRLRGANIAPALAAGRAFASHSDLVTKIEIYAPDYQPETNPTGHMDYTAELLAQVQAAGADYTIFALTIGGNTSDYDIPENEQGENARGDRNNTNTSGLKYWPLNDDLTLQVRNAPGNVMPYGVMRLGPSVLPPAAPEGAEEAAPENGGGGGGGGAVHH